MAISNENAARSTEIARIEQGNPNYRRMADTMSFEYKQMLEAALECVEAYAQENGLSAKEKKELEQAQIINARRYYLNARNQDNVRNGGFYARRDIETNNKEMIALNNLYSQKLSNGLNQHIGKFEQYAAQRMQSQQQTSKKTKTNKKKAAA